MNVAGMKKEEMDTPALCLDIDAVDNNLRSMIDFLTPLGCRLRPHFKTNKIPILAHRQLNAGAVGITCAGIGEAEILATAGIRDILIANELVTEGKIRRLASLAAYTDIMVAVDTQQNARDINRIAFERNVTVRVLIEIDVGMGRCGIRPDGAAVELARKIMECKALRFEGIMGYEGHAVMIPDPVVREAEAKKSLELLVRTKELLLQAGIPVSIVSCGGTGTYKTSAGYPGITEVQCGSYLTMDSQYRDKVGIKDFDCALSLLSTVIHVDENKALGDAGMKSLSSDFGMPVVVRPGGWEITKLAEEHCFLRRIDGPPLSVGEKIVIVPSHGCTTINLHDVYHVFRDNCLIALWPISARGKSM